ncbi:Hypothetical protein A7982_09661 [Minicystis rosea]|nr:Hypothetical protein A7982_09661 [Minicystis rosea]
MELRSFKLRFTDKHVRAVPRTDARGCPFSGPGVDLRGSEAEAAFAAAAPMVAALAEAEPGIQVRSMAVDFERPRVTATLDPTTPDTDPHARVVRLDDGPLLRRMIAACEPAVAVITAAATRALARREEAG